MNDPDRNADYKNNFITLHRHFIWADRMRVHFTETTLKEAKTNTLSMESKAGIESFMYMSVWYGLLFVVVEAWQELKLKDEKIDRLLTSPNVDHLRLFRNATFHYQKEYFGKKQLGFISSEDNPVQWVNELNTELSRFFLDELKLLQRPTT